MRKIVVKRLVYRDVNTHEVFYGAEEYDGRISDRNILESVYEAGKHTWRVYGWSLYQWNKSGEVQYRIDAIPFYYLESSWYDDILDSMKKILRK